ncbi:hypothetical protein H9L39_00752 [Fusarium oxysporum f. sp. albedinis]|nr:hypothetical protein H9L39_00752 [Fusarium oxysporum f. sp. albedinis]
MNQLGHFSSVAPCTLTGVSTRKQNQCRIRDRDDMQQRQFSNEARIQLAPNCRVLCAVTQRLVKLYRETVFTASRSNSRRDSADR